MTVTEAIDNHPEVVKALQVSGYLSINATRDNDIYKRYVVERPKHKTKHDTVITLTAIFNISCTTIYDACKRINPNFV